MAKEYIEREAALSDLKEELEYDTPMYTEEQNRYIKSGLRIAIKDIKYLPTADVVEIRHGKWIWKELYDEIGYILVCSACEESEGACERFDYCPNCGARMDSN